MSATEQEQTKAETEVSIKEQQKEEPEQQNAGSSSATENVAEDGESQEEDEEDIDAEAQELIGQGKRNLVVGDPPAAVQCLQEACALLAGKYGEMADECAEAYFHYGCALLELASMENGVLGNALQGVPDESADSEDEDEGAAPQKRNVESPDDLEEKEKEEVFKQVQEALEAATESEDSEVEGKKDEGKEEKKDEEGKEEKMEEGGEGERKKEESEKEGEKAKIEGKEMKEEGKMDKNKEEEMETEEKEGKKDEKEEEQKEIEKEEAKVEGKKEELKENEAGGEEKIQEDAKQVEKDQKDKEGEKEEDKAKVEKKDEDDGAGPSTEKTEEEKEKDDDVPNFQLAWEMLELARCIISKRETEGSKLKVAQIHLKLGELGLETEQYAQSVVDFTSCLEIQQKFLEPASRQIAGTHYNLGLAYSFANQFDESIENYKLSKELIEKRLAELEKKVTETKEKDKGKEKAGEEEDPLEVAQKEIDELKELLPDVVSKLDDAIEMKRQGGLPRDGAGPSTSSGFSAPSSAFDKPSSAFDKPSSSEPAQIAVKKSDEATDITHMLRRKRKPEEADSQDEENAPSGDAKRSRQDGTEENGDKTNGQVAQNGSTAAVNGAGDQTNGQVNGTVANGDVNMSPEKPSEIKTKKLPTEEAPAAMETA